MTDERCFEWKSSFGEGLWLWWVGPLHLQIILFLLQLSYGAGSESRGKKQEDLKTHQWNESVVSFNEEDLKSVKIVFFQIHRHEYLSLFITSHAPSALFLLKDLWRMVVIWIMVITVHFSCWSLNHSPEFNCKIKYCICLKSHGSKPGKKSGTSYLQVRTQFWF